MSNIDCGKDEGYIFTDARRYLYQEELRRRYFFCKCISTLLFFM